MASLGRPSILRQAAPSLPLTSAPVGLRMPCPTFPVPRVLADEQTALPSRPAIPGRPLPSVGP
eukprot:11343823-Heterocapsa_arctica.AAC.1